jgi:hypothetical protein
MTYAHVVAGESSDRAAAVGRGDRNGSRTPAQVNPRRSPELLSFVNRMPFMATGKCEFRFPCAGNDSRQTAITQKLIRETEVSFSTGQPDWLNQLSGKTLNPKLLRQGG